MPDRWTIRECPEHGLIGARIYSRAVPDDRCPVCFRALSGEFEVVRAVGARSSDPDTSKLAALRQEPRSNSQRGRILRALALNGRAMTARELEEATGIKGAWKRISELKQGGHVFETGTVHDDKTGTDVTLYLALQSGPFEASYLGRDVE